jgi:T4 RnlA family RNA ligase
MITKYEMFLEKLGGTYFIPTYEECREICNSNGNLIFFESKHNVDGYDISVFNYRLAGYKEFMEPVKGKTIDAKELRGISFVFNTDGSLYKRYLMLQKFWNLEQVPETQYNVLKGKKIKAVYNKEDGSLCSFIELPNGNVVAKTKGSFDNDQTKVINEIYEHDENLQKFLKYCFKNDLVAMFEYVSFKNRIVLKYEDTKLILLRVRDNTTGEYLDVEDFRDQGIEIVPKEEVGDLDEILKFLETAEDKEGFVVQYEDDYMIKVKTPWYISKHSLMDSLDKENIIIKMILEETIDDITASLDSITDKEELDYIDNIEKKIHKYISNKMKEIEDLKQKYDELEGTEHYRKKFFALSYIKNTNFPLVMNVLKGKTIYDSVKEYILKITNKLESARSFLDSIT